MKFLAPSLLLYLSFLLDGLPIAQAIHLPLKARMGGFGHGGLARRASLTGTPDLTNQGNMQYQTNITLNGQAFQVLIDTGRSVPPHTPPQLVLIGGRTQFGLVRGGKREWREGHWQGRRGHLRDRFHEGCVLLGSSVCALSGAYDVVAGPIKTATVEFEGFKVDNQVFSEHSSASILRAQVVLMKFYV